MTWTEGDPTTGPWLHPPISECLSDTIRAPGALFTTARSRAGFGAHDRRLPRVDHLNRGDSISGIFQWYNLPTWI